MYARTRKWLRSLFAGTERKTPLSILSLISSKLLARLDFEQTTCVPRSILITYGRLSREKTGMCWSTSICSCWIWLLNLLLLIYAQFPVLISLCYISLVRRYLIHVLAAKHFNGSKPVFWAIWKNRAGNNDHGWKGYHDRNTSSTTLKVVVDIQMRVQIVEPSHLRSYIHIQLFA